jgi:hypothetical protein
MLWLISSLVILIIIMAVGLIIAVKVMSRLVSLIENLEEQIEKSLDVLDACYGEINKVLTTPVFYNDPIIKMTLKSIKRAHASILLIANKIASFSSESVDGRKEKDDDDSER